MGMMDYDDLYSLPHWRTRQSVSSPDQSGRAPSKRAFIVVHPLVLLSVADHHGRALARGSTKRVIGVLLGQDLGKTINVANSFGIPFEEDERDPKTWFLDHNYIDGMYSMFRKVNGMWASSLSLGREH